MDKALKQRMVGAVVLIALAVIFIPMLLNGNSEQGTRTVSLDIPSPPEEQYRSRLLPLEGSGNGKESATGAQPQGQVARSANPPPGSTANDGGASPKPTPPPPDETKQSAQPGQAPASTPEPAESGSQASAGSGTAGGSKAAPLSNWFVQVGSFSSRDNAQELRDRLRNAGYTAFVETSTVDGTTTHRVKVGPEMDKARAAKDQQEIQDKFGLKGLVISES